jgi:hypothetical protein
MNWTWWADNLVHRSRRADNLVHRNRCADDLVYRNRCADNLVHRNRCANHLVYRNWRANYWMNLNRWTNYVSDYRSADWRGDTDWRRRHMVDGLRIAHRNRVARASRRGVVVHICLMN